MSLFTRLEVPAKDKVVESSGLVTRPWDEFFRLIRIIIDPLGREKDFPLENNISVAKDITELSFSAATVSQAVVDYVIQRVTTSTGAVELIQTGSFYVVYKPVSLTWVLLSMGTPAPSNAGITLSINTKGQMKYTSSNITGTPSISRIVYRARTLGAKNYQYSKAGL